MTTLDTKTLETECDRLVSQNVNACFSAMVATLAAGAYQGHGLAKDLAILTAQASELSASLLDYESAAHEAGWYFADDKWRHPNNAVACKHADDLEDWITPHEREILEHWSVSQWLAEKLQARGERIDLDFAGLCVWGRTISGQSIAMDPVILDIVKELHA